MYFISAPFGNFLQFENATSVTGTFTYLPRPGRLGQILRTLRYVKTEAGWSWRNQLGLRNPGIHHALKRHKWHNVMSIASLEREDWHKLYAHITTKQNVEINISCPNVQHNPDVLFGLDLWPRTNRRWCIIKVPPTIEHKTIDILVDIGYNQIHASNTLPTEKGGLSGKILAPYTLGIIEYIKSTHPHVEVIAGGGITDRFSRDRYLDAGADHISLGSVCFTPWRIKSLLN
tara:strand:- start:2351 stop:3043 length:693 start_codon:yes stop_codon:yes gene_type:complete